MTALENRILLHLQDGRRIPVDPREIYVLEAEGGETLVRTRHAQPLTDVRQLSELIDAIEPVGFAQIHRSWAVNLRRMRSSSSSMRMTAASPRIRVSSRSAVGMYLATMAKWY